MEHLDMSVFVEVKYKDGDCLAMNKLLNIRCLWMLTLRIWRSFLNSYVLKISD